MNISDLLWVIPGNQLEEKGLIDGKLMTFTKTEKEKRHAEILGKFMDDYELKKPSSMSEVDYAEALCKEGIFVLINAGKIDGKYAAGLFLPENLTDHQIDTLEALEEIFKQSFYQDLSFFEPCVYSINTSLTYKLKNNTFRDLHIESIIEGKEIKDGQELLYKELQRQKENKPKSL